MSVRLALLPQAEGIMMVLTGLDAAMLHTFEHSEVNPHHYPSAPRQSSAAPTAARPPNGQGADHC